MTNKYLPWEPDLDLPIETIRRAALIVALWGDTLEERRQFLADLGIDPARLPRMPGHPEPHTLRRCSGCGLWITHHTTSHWPLCTACHHHQENR